MNQQEAVQVFPLSEGRKEKSLLPLLSTYKHLSQLLKLLFTLNNSNKMDLPFQFSAKCWQVA